MIGKYLESLDDDALRRVIEEPMGDCAYSCDPQGAPRCLSQVARGRAREPFMDYAVARRYDNLRYDLNGHGRSLRHRWGPRIVGLIKARAQRILDARHASRLGVHTLEQVET